MFVTLQWCDKILKRQKREREGNKKQTLSHTSHVRARHLRWRPPFPFCLHLLPRDYYICDRHDDELFDSSISTSLGWRNGCDGSCVLLFRSSFRCYELPDYVNRVVCVFEVVAGKVGIGKQSLRNETKTMLVDWGIVTICLSYIEVMSALLGNVMKHFLPGRTLKRQNSIVKRVKRFWQLAVFHL